jgi:hypothetical protein
VEVDAFLNQPVFASTIGMPAEGMPVSPFTPGSETRMDGAGNVVDGCCTGHHNGIGNYQDLAPFSSLRR